MISHRHHAAAQKRQPNFTCRPEGNNYSKEMKLILPALSIPLFMLCAALPVAHAGTLTIACEDNLPPFSSETGGQPHGIVVDIVQLSPSNWAE
jgi:polar amino acid transport system substrate-binding protein